MRTWAGATGILLGLVGWGAAMAADDRGRDADGRLREAFQAYLDESFRAEPLRATRLGDHRFDDRLDDLSADARAANVERDRRMLARLAKEFRPEDLSRDGRVDLEV